MTNVLVTGASGFIGRNLCAALRDAGYKVHAQIRRNTEGPWDKTFLHDFSSNASLDEAVHGVDIIFHLAAKVHAVGDLQYDLEDYFRINTRGTRALLKAAKSAGVRRFVFFSSVLAMGKGSEVCLDERASCHPQTPYGSSKLEAETLVLVPEGGYVPEPVVLRLPMVYGPTHKGNLPRMIKAMEQGRFPPLFAVENKRSMVHVDDVIQAAMLAAEKPEAINQIFNVTDGTPYSTGQMYEWICESLGKPLSRWSAPLPLLKLLAKTGDIIGRARGRRFMFNSDALDKLTGSACYSTEKIECQLGFSPMHHLRDSLPEMVRYLEEMKN